MPQLVPFYFMNQLFFLFLTIIILIYISSKFFLPFFSTQQTIRLYITYLLKKINK
jgi:F-type H+-transporting ATPase subunit 8